MTHHTTHDLIMTGHGLVLTDSLRDFISGKTNRLFRHDGRIIRIRVELGMDLNRESQRIFSARGLLEIEGPTMVACEKSESAYKAIELMVHKLDRQLRQRHRRRRYKRVHPRSIDVPANLPKTGITDPYGESGMGLNVA